jgi:hypothetical protein
VQWHLPAGKPVVSIIRPTADRRTIFVTDGQSTLWALDRQTGKIRWHYAPPRPPANHSYLILTPTATPAAIYVTVNQRLKLTAAAILVSRASTSVLAAPAA